MSQRKGTSPHKNPRDLIKKFTKPKLTVDDGPLFEEDLAIEPVHQPEVIEATPTKADENPVLDSQKMEDKLSTDNQLVDPEPKTPLESIVAPQPEVKTVVVDRLIRYDDVAFVGAIFSNNINKAEDELRNIIKIDPEYPQNCDIISRLCDDLVHLNSTDIYKQAITIISQELKETKNSDAIHQQVSSIIKSQRESAIKWLVERKFKLGNSAEIIIENFLKLHFIRPSSPNTPLKIDDRQYNISLTYFDIINQLIDAKSIGKSIITKLNEYCPYLTELLLQRGMNPADIVDGNPIAWYIMRSATNQIPFKDNTTLGQVFLTRLLNCQTFTCEPHYFTGCNDIKVFQVIKSKAEFKANIANIMPDGYLFISTITDDRFVNDLIALGSPLPDGNMFTIGLSDKKATLEKMHKVKPIDFSKRHPHDDLTLFSYYLLNGPMTVNLFDTLKFIYGECKDPSHCLGVVYANQQNKAFYLRWNPLHLLWSRFDYNWSDVQIDVFKSIAKWLYGIVIDHVAYNFDIARRLAFMTIPFPFNHQPSNGQYNRDEEPYSAMLLYNSLLSEFSQYESRALKSININCNPEPISSAITNWMSLEHEARKKDEIIRSRHARPDLLKQVPWN